MRIGLALLALAGFVVAPAHAEQANSDPASWLARIAAAAQKLSYTGTFVYHSGNHTETSRITHVVDASGEREKLEVLDGSPREVVRHNDEVKCYLPEQRIVIVERQTPRKAFPARLPASLGNLADNYNIRKGEVSRVADREGQLLILEPKDKLRYGHMLWADTASGLLLKARMIDEKNEPIEQFYFTSVQIGGVIDKESLKPKLAGKAADWRVHNARTTETRIDGGDWLFKTELAGFRQSASMKRQLEKNAPEITHVVFSDGLAAISVFIEPLSAHSGQAQTGFFSTGAINVYKRVNGDHLLTVLGEVPPQTLKKLGDGIEQRKK